MVCLSSEYRHRAFLVFPPPAPIRPYRTRLRQTVLFHKVSFLYPLSYSYCKTYCSRFAFFQRAWRQVLRFTRPFFRNWFRAIGLALAARFALSKCDPHLVCALIWYTYGIDGGTALYGYGHFTEGSVRCWRWDFFFNASAWSVLRSTFWIILRLGPRQRGRKFPCDKQ